MGSSQGGLVPSHLPCTKGQSDTDQVLLPPRGAERA